MDRGGGRHRHGGGEGHGEARTRSPGTAGESARDAWCRGSDLPPEVTMLER